MPFSLWFRTFEYEFRRRTGITWSDASGEMDICHTYFNNRVRPTHAVLAEIQHLDLVDMTLEPWLTVC